jgi:hypothetical protein
MLLTLLQRQEHSALVKQYSSGKETIQPGLPPGI